MFENKEKKYFKQKHSGIEKMIWDLEFKRFKTREIREEIRVEYDNLKSRLSILEAQPESKDEKEKAQREAETKVMKETMDRFEKQMAALDVEVNGTKPNELYPEGHDGISQQLESLRELKDMVRDYIKQI